MPGSDGDVVITGVGLHGPFGDLSATVSAIKQGRSALSMAIPAGVDAFPPCPGATAEPASPAPFLPDRKLAKYMSQTTSLSVIAAGRALSDAGVIDSDDVLQPMGLFAAVGMTVFDLSSVSRAVERSKAPDGTLDLQRMGTEGLGACHPLMPFKSLLNMPVGLISICFNLKGPNFVTYPSVDQAGACLETAARGLVEGRFTEVLVGAASQGFSLMTLCTQLRLGRLAETVEQAVPFEPQHRGIAPADGAGLFVMTTRGTAARRGTPIRARVLGVSHGRSEGTTPDELYAVRRRHWARALGNRQPSRIVSCGNPDRTADIAEADQRDAFPQTERARLVSFDGALGELGPAGVFFAVALVLTGDPPGNAPIDSTDRCYLISAGDADGAQFALALAPEEGSGA